MTMRLLALNACWAGARMYKVLAKAWTAALHRRETASGWGWLGGRANLMAPLPGLITD
jgi:hypothetical protein